MLREVLAYPHLVALLLWITCAYVPVVILMVLYIYTVEPMSSTATVECALAAPHMCGRGLPTIKPLQRGHNTHLVLYPEIYTRINDHVLYQKE